MQVSIFLCQWKSCCVENCCLAQALDIRFDFLLRRHYMLCLFQCQSDSALTRTYWSSRGTAGRNSRFKLFLLLILGAFSFSFFSRLLKWGIFTGCTLKLSLNHLHTELNLGYLKGTKFCLESKASFIDISNIASFKSFLIAWLRKNCTF